MKEIFDQSGQLNVALFEPHLLQQTANLGAVLAATRRTQSKQVESTHFLLALAGIANGFTQNFFYREGIIGGDLQGGLEACCVRSPGAPPPPRLTRETLDDSGRRLVASLRADFSADQAPQIGEKELLIAALKNLTAPVTDHLAGGGLTPAALLAKLQQIVPPPRPFDNSHLRREAFSPGAWQVLGLMKTEAVALGYPKMDPRHLLLALLEYEGGATQSALYQQNIAPKKAQERIMVNLRARASKSRSQLNLDRDSLNEAVVQILDRAAQAAQDDGCGQIAETHLLRAFLQSETFAVRQLMDAGVDLAAAQEAARRFSPQDEPSLAGSTDMRPWSEVKASLESALVGQQDAINMCLPLIRRMHFDFRRTGKPAGVFLFCGPSGSGKTEMAKAIARAVFGSEDRLIMLEMGQFQTKESMNIFVGAPPAYVGYGEGKLTNGLRDKPRSVVLFDEIEKAYPEVFDALLRFIDEGRIDDPAGPVRDGTECIIVMTSNVRTDDLESLLKDDGYRKNKWELRRRLQEALLNRSAGPPAGSPGREFFRFRPEFLNRIDEIVLFRTLDKEDMKKIAERHLIEYQRRLKEEKQVSLVYSPNPDAVARYIGTFCADLHEGARATLRVAQAAVLDPVIDFICDRACSLPASLVVHVAPNEETGEPYAKKVALLSGETAEL